MGNEHHNKGERDSSKGEYDPPHSLLDEFLTVMNPLERSEKITEIAKDNEEYNAGWNNTHKQKEESSGGCFLTTACVTYHGLPDDCSELEVLRRFRDSFLQFQSDGKTILADYYRVAPLIVKEISLSEDASSIYRAIYGDIELIVDMIEKGRHDDAVAAYGRMYYALRDKFLNR